MNPIDFVCGLVGGLTQILAGQPLDYIKVRMQTAAATQSIVQVSRDIYRQHGMMGFYKGASSVVFGYTITIGIQFAIYEWARREIYGLRIGGVFNEEKLRLWQVGVSGLITGVAASLIFCPVEYVKIQKQMVGNLKGSSVGLLFSDIRNNGLSNIFRGLWATVAREAVGNFFYFSSYEATLRYLTGNVRQKATWAHFLVAGGAAGLAYYLFAYPLDILKTNIQMGRSLEESVRNALKMRGYGVVLARAVLINAAHFIAYEKCQSLAKAYKNPYYSMY